MKTITMDYALYNKELEEAEEIGFEKCQDEMRADVDYNKIRIERIESLIKINDKTKNYIGQGEENLLNKLVDILNSRRKDSYILCKGYGVEILRDD